MDRVGLRLFLDGAWGCLCGSPQTACAALLKLLRLHPLYEHHREFEAWVPDEGVQHLLLYTIDKLGLTEHGTSIGGQWLTGKGVAVRDALAREEGDDFEALLGSHCIHGHDISDDAHDCYATPAPEPAP